MAKVLRIINRFNLGGPVNNALYLSKYIDDEYETKLIGGVHTKEEISAEFLFQELQVPYEIVPAMSREISLWGDIKAFIQVYKIAREYKPDIIHTHASKAGLIGRLVGVLLRTPILVHTFHGHVFHSYFGSFKTKFFIKIERFLAKRTHKIIAISQIQKEDLVTKYKIADDEKVAVIPLGFDLNRFKENQKEKRSSFRKKYQLNDDTIVISIVGRLVPIKNHQLFIDAIAKLKLLSSQKFTSFIVGDGDIKKDLIAYAESKGLTVSEDNGKSDLVFTSWIKETDYVFAGSDIIALSSKNEGTPVTLIEAQVASKPIVTTNVGGILDILEESEFNKISTHKPDDFAQKLLELSLLDINNISPIISEVVSKRFHYTELAKRVSVLYNDLLKPNRTIKLLHIVNRFNLGGHIYKPLYLSKYLPEEYETLVVGGIHTEEEESSEFLFKEEAVRYEIIPEMSRAIDLFDDIRAYWKIRNVIRRFKPDIIHTHASKAGVLGRFAVLFSNKYIVIHTFHGHVFHSYFGKFKTSIIKFIERTLAYKSTAIIAVSNLQKKDFCSVYNISKENKTFVIPMGMDLEKFRTNLPEKRMSFRQEYKIEEDEIIISIVGRIVPIKNHALLIDAFALLKQKTDKKVRLFIVGDGDLKSHLFEQCQSLNLSFSLGKEGNRDVVFTSWIRNVDYLYAGSDIITLTSFNEGTPIALIEAQVANKPIVTTNAGGTADILEPSPYHIISESNPESFSTALVSIVDQINEESIISSSIQKRIIESYSYTNMAKEMNQLYKKLMK